MKSGFRLLCLATAAVVLAGVLASCSSTETYAEQKEKERNAINSFLSRDVAIVDDEGDTVVYVGRINVISEEQFYEQDSTTDLSNNEYVLFNNSGVYMQIVRKGAGERITSGQTKQVVARYLEFNILRDSIQTRNDVLYWHTTPDVIEIANSYGSFTASFSTENGGGAMYRIYGQTEVPAGWLVPFTYINIGRQVEEGDKISKVRLIVPHSAGHYEARQNVYPCFYEILFQEMRE